MHALALWDYAFYALNTHYGGTRCLSFWGLGQKDITLCIIIQFFTNEALRPKCIASEIPPDSQRANIFKIFEAVEICRNFLAINVNIYLEFNSKM